MLDNILVDDISESERDEILSKVADELVRRRLVAPSLFFMEMCKPLNFIGSQALIAVHPFIQAILSLLGAQQATPLLKKFALLMEKRENVEILMNLIENYNQNAKISQ